MNNKLKIENFSVFSIFLANIILIIKINGDKAYKTAVMKPISVKNSKLWILSIKNYLLYFMAPKYYIKNI